MFKKTALFLQDGFPNTNDTVYIDIETRSARNASNAIIASDASDASDSNKASAFVIRLLSYKFCF